MQIFVGGLDPSVSDETLRGVFGQFGELIHVKIPVGKRCGFVQFANRCQHKSPLKVYFLFPYLPLFGMFQRVCRTSFIDSKWN